MNMYMYNPKSGVGVYFNVYTDETIIKKGDYVINLLIVCKVPQCTAISTVST